MGIYRAYEVDSSGISIGGTSATPALYCLPTTTSDANIVRIKVAIEAASSPAPPSNGSVLFQLAKVTGTQGGGATALADPIGPSTLAANTTFKSGSTAITGLTQGVTLWTGVVPFTAGASWEDAYENTGLEIYLPSGTAAYCMYFTAASGAGSGCNARVILNFSE
jgi:hypothetical protein